jgi:hypothetical protein
MPQWIFWEDNISFVVFWAAVYWEIITIGVDYTDFEEKDCERKKFLYVFTITSPALHREKKFFFREILIIFRGVFKFH